MYNVHESKYNCNNLNWKTPGDISCRNTDTNNLCLFLIYLIALTTKVVHRNGMERVSFTLPSTSPLILLTDLFDIQKGCASHFAHCPDPIPWWW